jgi:hypothetical protein
MFSGKITVIAFLLPIHVQGADPGVRFSKTASKDTREYSRNLVGSPWRWLHKLASTLASRQA